MVTNLFNYLVRFVLLIIIQVMILNNINLGGYINPYVYVLFILLLPVDVPGYVLLLSAFGLGLTIDLFSDSHGMHAAASVFLAFARPGIIRLISIRGDFDPGTVPMVSNMGTTWILSYIFVLVFLHHSLLFFLEIFRFSEFFHTLWRVLLSTGISSILIFLGFLLIEKPEKRKK